MHIGWLERLSPLTVEADRWLLDQIDKYHTGTWRTDGKLCDWAGECRLYTDDNRVPARCLRELGHPGMHIITPKEISPSPKESTP